MDPILFAQSTADVSDNIVTKLLSPELFVLLIPIVAIVGGLAAGMVKIIAVQLRKAKQTEYEVALKSQMLEQGKSVEEIERVLNAGRTTDRS